MVVLRRINSPKMKGCDFLDNKVPVQCLPSYVFFFLFFFSVGSLDDYEVLMVSTCDMKGTQLLLVNPVYVDRSIRFY